MPYGRIRPPRWSWRSAYRRHREALDDALYGTISIHDALARGQATVQRELDAFYNQDRYPIVDLSIAGVIVAAGLRPWP